MTRPRYSSTLLRYITSFEITPDNNLILNQLDREAEFISQFFTPRYKVSELASNVLREIESGRILPMRTPPNKDSFLEKMTTNNSRYNDNNLYQLGKTILLESFSILYLLEEKPEFAHFLSERDIRQVRVNIKYFLDSIGRKDEYLNLKEDLYNFDLALGYIQAQIPVIKEEARLGILGGVLDIGSL